MRKLLCSLLLPLILLLTQQGAVVHALSHLGAGNNASSSSTASPSDQPHAKDTLCALCLGLQHLSGWVAGLPAAPALLDLAHVQATMAPRAWQDRSAPEARSRGPPVSL